MSVRSPEPPAGAAEALDASEMGYPVYLRLGFRDVSRLRSYALDM